MCIYTLNMLAELYYRIGIVKKDHLEKRNKKKLIKTKPFPFTTYVKRLIES